MRHDLRVIKPALFLMTILAIGFGLLFKQNKIYRLQELPELTWSLLATVEPDFIPNEVRRYTSKSAIPVRIAGFVVPLSDSIKRIKEFLLVPDSMSCIHLPPPPSNQMIMVKLDQEIDIDLANGPVWVSGYLKTESETHGFGASTFSMSGLNVLPYEALKLDLGIR